ncbi:uncharacterized protein PV09_07524 [Verruconis gallopava]|uniref:PhoD-like phosphatase domain-containing protein n=1 Tax=Verruconis gallopava TaxID=253628 RepID=A0A0D1YJJ0_9PEZI|nr:uncharacterized protein PV09_07524 [Verruconis gallopava]KIW01007.1 hypothetical protein PV09_07524 [Verruconis gallopava]
MSNTARRQSNSSALRYSADFASDRSPLQKVESIVNGMRQDMSKEEKRARLLEAEERLAASRRKGPVHSSNSGGNATTAQRPGRYTEDPNVADEPAQSRPLERSVTTRTDYRTEAPPASTSALSPSEMRRQARARLSNQAEPLQDYSVVRNDSRRRSDGVQPRVLSKPPPHDTRAVSDPYSQPPARQRSVREGRVFDADPDYVESGYNKPMMSAERQQDYPPHGYGRDEDVDAQFRGTSSGGVLGRVKSIFKRNKRRDSMPAQEQYSAPDAYEPAADSKQHHHHLHFHNNEDHARRYQSPRYRDYRQDAQTASIGATDTAQAAQDPSAAPLIPAAKVQDNRAWWEKPPPSSTSRRRSMGPGAGEGTAAAQDSAAAVPAAKQPVTTNRRAETHQTSYQQPQPGQQTYFQPQLYLKCGPLLRFTGLRKSSQTPNKDVWTGSIMIVTLDSKSRYDTPPSLRIFKQPVDLLPPPPGHIDEASGQQLPPEYVDPVAGQIKMSRVGKTLYVKPVETLDEKRDLSRIEDDSGLFEEQRSQPLQPPSGKGTTGGLRSVGQDGELRGKFQDIPAYVLYKERGVTFWKWNLEIGLSDRQLRLAYRINRGPAVGFWVPARGETMNIMFHTCNGFSLSVEPDEFSGPDPLWRDVLNAHQTRPFHAMIGGGDQIYMDAATVQTKYFGEWANSKNPHYKHNAPFTAEMQEELEKFYLNRYSMWFSQGMFGLANSQIPMINMWDDHDIIDGFGSYPDHTMSCPVMSGIGNVAFKYYMLFQHQSLPIEDQATEPSWLLGAERGPYITELSRSLFMWLGRRTALLALDCRTERTRDEILSQGTWDLVFERLRKEIVKGETHHLLVLLGVPIAYPRLNFLENILTSRLMDPVKALGRTGVLGGFVNKFDGGAEILDDLDDHWTAKHHKDERNWFIQELQELAADLSVRITILSGDVHLCAVGQFYSNKTLGIPKDQDHRYMPNVISSAIVNTPPADMVADVLNKRNKVHHLDDETDEDMVPIFSEDVNNKARNNKHLLPRRNWCSIREYKPEMTPPPTPSPPMTPDGSYKQRPGLTRSLSLGRGPSLPGAGLIRRLSQRGQRNSVSHPPVAFNQRMHDPEYYNRRASTDAVRRGSADISRARGAEHVSESDLARGPANERPNPFMRRPTIVLPNNPKYMVNLRGGLDIRLNCENERGDPAGTTTEYRLIVPTLDYRGDGDPNPEEVKPQSRLSKLFRSATSRRAQPNYSEESLTPPPSVHQHNKPPPSRPTNDSFDSIQQEPVPVAAIHQRHARRDSLNPPEQVVKGPNGLPTKSKKAERPVANSSAPVPSVAQTGPTPSTGFSMRRQDPPQAQQQRRSQQYTVSPRAETYAGPNTIIPDHLPPPPPGQPPASTTQRAVLTGDQRVASDSRYSARRTSEGQTVGEKKRASAGNGGAGYV